MSWIRKSSSILLLYSLWVSISIGNLFLTKWILSDRQVPESFLIFGQLVVSLFLVTSTSEAKCILYNVNALKELFVLSLFSTLIYLLKYVGLARISLTLAVTLRCASPIFQVATQKKYIVFGDRFSVKSLASLVPIFFGLVLASFAESNVTAEVENFGTKRSILFGSFASILSNLLGVFHSLFAKSMLSKQLSPLTLQTYQSGIGCFLVFPLLLYDWKFFHELKDRQVLAILVFKGSLSFVQLHVALKVLDKMSTVGFSIAGSTRRVLTCILTVLFYYENSLSFIHWVGTFISLAGILLYDSAQRTNHKTKVEEQVLMTVSSDCSLYSRENNEHEYLETK